MKIEVDTINDSVDELKKTITLLQEALEKRTGITAENTKAPLRPSEFKHTEPKLIFEDIMSTTPPKRKIEVQSTQNKEFQKKDILNTKDIVKKRKSPRQDDKLPEEEEEDEDRQLPQIQYKDYW